MNHDCSKECAAAVRAALAQPAPTITINGHDYILDSLAVANVREATAHLQAVIEQRDAMLAAHRDKIRSHEATIADLSDQLSEWPGIDSGIDS